MMADLPACPGVEQIRDDNIDTYRQSDGAQPHLINIQFHKKMSIVEVALYLDYNLDESYTPKKIAVKAGSTFHDLVEVQLVDLHEPMGWVRLPLSTNPPSSSTATSSLLRAYFIQICIIAMHQNGRDTHVRQAKVFGPRYAITPLSSHNYTTNGTATKISSQDDDGGVLEPTSIELSQFSVIR